jgi:hypothetical protein
MPEASSRILVDRNVVRLDGRPFFSFGPRVYLTPQERFHEALTAIAAAGFNTVVSPPASHGTLTLLDHFFEAATAAGLQVVLAADPRLPEHGRYLADRFCHHRALHSYMLPPRGGDKAALQAFLRERDSIRAKDLFHPIWLPLPPQGIDSAWLRAMDIHAPLCPQPQVTSHRLNQPRPGRDIAALRQAHRDVSPRPMICPNLPVGISDAERESGLFDDDPWVSRFSPRAVDWFPYLANLSRLPRRDLLGPQPEILRLHIYELLSAGARGILLDFHELFGGLSPYTGRDRFLEAAVLAQEITLFSDFFAEGQPAELTIETGHPRLGATAIRHGRETLIVLRMEGYEEDFFVDEAFMERTEITVEAEGLEGTRAWRMDFPEPRALEVVRDGSRSMRFLAGPLELTGLILLSPGTRRAEELAHAVRQRLPRVATAVVQELEVRLGKISLIEGELAQLGAGIDNADRLRHLLLGLDEARQLLAQEAFVDAHDRAREAGRRIRQLIKYQMAKALAMSLFDRHTRLGPLRLSYFTLPRFYREGAQEAARAFVDLT